MLTEELCRDRSEMIASYMIEHKVTVREAAGGSQALSCKQKYGT